MSTELKELETDALNYLNNNKHWIKGDTHRTLALNVFMDCAQRYKEMQGWVDVKEVQQMIRATIAETVDAFEEFIKEDAIIREAEGGKILPDAVIDILPDLPVGQLMNRVFSRLEKHGIKFSALPAPPIVNDNKKD